ncbi:MAG: hypothetical protein WCY05_07670 [Candidatus Omnitrophota bacterium]
MDAYTTIEKTCPKNCDLTDLEWHIGDNFIFCPLCGDKLNIQEVKHDFSFIPLTNEEISKMMTSEEIGKALGECSKIFKEELNKPSPFISLFMENK